MSIKSTGIGTAHPRRIQVEPTNKNKPEKPTWCSPMARIGRCVFNVLGAIGNSISHACGAIGHKSALQGVGTALIMAGFEATLGIQASAAHLVMILGCGIVMKRPFNRSLSFLLPSLLGGVVGWLPRTVIPYSVIKSDDSIAECFNPEIPGKIYCTLSAIAGAALLACHTYKDTGEQLNKT